MIFLHLNCVDSVGTIHFFSYTNINYNLIAKYVSANQQTYKNAIDCKRKLLEYRGQYNLKKVHKIIYIKNKT